jgi:hypothetical protein
MSEKRIKMDKVEQFINESFRLNCSLAKEIAFTRYQTNKKLIFFGKRKIITFEEFKNIVLKEYEDSIRELPKNIAEDLETIAKNVVNDVKNGRRPKLQKIIENYYKLLLKEI